MRHAQRPAPDQRLGELAYAAYWRVMAPLCLPWARLTTTEKSAWQAAARAAIRAGSTNAGAKKRWPHDMLAPAPEETP